MPSRKDRQTPRSPLTFPCNRYERGPRVCHRTEFHTEGTRPPAHLIQRLLTGDPQKCAAPLSTSRSDARLLLPPGAPQKTVQSLSLLPATRSAPPPQAQQLRPL